MSVLDKLQEMGLQLPAVAKPVAAYVPAVRAGNLVYTSGQIPMVEGKLKYTGRLGKDVSLEDGYDAARICCLNALAAVRSLVGELDNVKRVVKLTGWVACTEDFTDQPKVMNGASELVANLFGDAGLHARAAVGTNALPLGSAVEVEMIVEVKA